MNWQTNRVVLATRSFARRAGLTRVMGSMLARGAYEERFDSALLDNVKPGDTVWDVGANIGYYSARLAEVIGETGHLYAFEPSLENLGKLRKKLDSLRNCAVLPYALGAESATLFMEQGGDDIGATSRVVTEAAPGRVAVEVMSADEVLASGKASIPDVIKIDVEGFELDVLKGMSALLKNSRLRTIGIEVHFGLLEARGLSSAPAIIVQILKGQDFNVEWPDASHIVAKRLSA